MKKIIFLMLFLALSSMVSAQKRTVEIGVLIDMNSQKTDSLLIALQNQVSAVVGQDAVISFSQENMLTNKYNIDTARKQYNRLLTNEVDMILAFGILNARIISEQTTHKKPTILFGGYNQELNQIDVTKKTSNIENLTYLIERESYAKDIEKLHELTKFDTLGIAVEKQLLTNLPLKETFDPILEKVGATYTFIPFEEISDIESKLTGIDAFYLAGGFMLNDAEVTRLAEKLIVEKVPSFTVNGVAQVKSGLMATHQPNDATEQIIRRLALTIEKYINGESLAEMPVFMAYNHRLTLNYNTADIVGIPIKYSLINSTDFVGELSANPLGRKYSLLEVIASALDENLDLQTSKIDVELSTQDVKTAKSDYLPSVTAAANATYTDPDVADLGFGQTPEFQTAATIRVEQTLFSEAANANISIQKNLQKAENENFNAEALNTVFDVSNSYFNTLIVKANAQIQLRNLEVTKKNFQIAEQNFEAGFSGKSDVLRLRSQLAQNTQTVVEAVNLLDQQYLSLNQLMNNPSDSKIDVADVNLSEGIFNTFNYNEFFDLLDDPLSRESFIDFLIAEAKKNAPELKALDYTLKATDRSIKLNGMGRFLPTLGVQGQYNNIFKRSGAGSLAPDGLVLPDNSYSVGATLSIPIFNRMRTTIAKQNAVLQRNQLNIQKENTALALDINVRNGVLNLTNQIANIELSKEFEKTAEDALNLTQASYTSGAVNIVQLIDAQNNLLSAKLASATAGYNYLIGAIQIERAIGHYFLLNSEEANKKFKQRFFDFLDNN